MDSIKSAIDGSKGLSPAVVFNSRKMDTKIFRCFVQVFSSDRASELRLLRRMIPAATLAK